MNIVEEVIVEYLRSNRRLVIPNFGAFMAKESGERIFSGLLRTDDGVLSSLLKARGLNEMEAAITIDRFIFEVRHELEQYGYCRLGEVGTLRIEPETKALRLYPPVHGELPKQTPYVPKIDERRKTRDERRTDAAEREQRVLAHFAEPQGGKACEAGLKTKDERQETKDESKSKSVGSEKETPNASNAPKKPRKKVDFVMVVAVIILLVALLGIGYGWYVSNLGVADDDAAMDALRVAPELINE